VTGPDDDPHDRPTRMTEIVDDGPQVLEQEPEAVADDAPRPWYRNRVLLALWALMVALLLTLIIYGIVELSRGSGETSGPANTTSTTTPALSSTTSPTTTPSTTTEDTPPPESPEQTPEEAPPPANNSPAPAPPHHHHHHIPSTIQLPHTVITVPHGF
jgi:cytoskeletal protein RodZ